MYVHCMYGLGTHPVPKWNIRITYGLGSDRFSPNYQKSMCVWFWFTPGYVIRVCTYNVCTGPYVHCTYGSVRILYVNELNTVNTVNDLFLRKAGRYLWQSPFQIV